MVTEFDVREIERVYEEHLYKLCDRIRDKYVIPFCKKYRMNFHSGMGVFFFERRSDKENMNTPEDDLMKWPCARHFRHSGQKWKAYCKLYEILEMQSKYSNCCLGCYVDEYIPNRKDKA